MRCLLLDAQAITTIDSTAVSTLASILDDLDSAGIQFGLARANVDIRTTLARAGLGKRIGPEHFYPTVRSAVLAYQSRCAVERAIQASA
jgi:anti-anti-sigma regulatory factor